MSYLPTAFLISTGDSRENPTIEDHGESNLEVSMVDVVDQAPRSASYFLRSSSLRSSRFAQIPHLLTTENYPVWT